MTICAERTAQVMRMIARCIRRPIPELQARMTGANSAEWRIKANQIEADARLLDSLADTLAKSEMSIDLLLAMEPEIASLVAMTFRTPGQA